MTLIALYVHTYAEWEIALNQNDDGRNYFLFYYTFSMG
jgi:hypothetical protein